MPRSSVQSRCLDSLVFQTTCWLQLVTITGAGGAGEQGTDEVFGGHSHVGTLIYLGDNWPAEYRNHLLTHNLHGHQINHQINLREQGGYRTVHAGQDVLFCADRQFIGVDLQYGPDGAVYFSDWYDPRHCHNPTSSSGTEETVACTA